MSFLSVSTKNEINNPCSDFDAVTARYTIVKGFRLRIEITDTGTRP